MNEIARVVESLRGDTDRANRKSPLRDLGFLSCTNAVHIRHAPFYEPCLILVLSGTKVVFEKGKPVRCPAGSLLAVPGPSSCDLRNEPDARTGKYSALLIPFKIELLDRLARSHNLMHEVRREPLGPLLFPPDNTLHESVRHYLTTTGSARLVSHRLMEILRVLATRNPALLSFGLQRERWSGRVRAVLAADLARAWTLPEVCARLATSERTLRRNLQDEGTGFRAVLHELRLASALTQLLSTALPVYRIAYDCGYQSVSRFTSNFHKRFGLPPTQFRASAGENGQNLTA